MFNENNFRLLKPNTFISCYEETRPNVYARNSNGWQASGLSVWFAHHDDLFSDVFLLICRTSISKQCLLPKTLHILRFRWIIPYQYSSQLLIVWWLQWPRRRE